MLLTAVCGENVQAITPAWEGNSWTECTSREGGAVSCCQRVAVAGCAGGVSSQRVSRRECGNEFHANGGSHPTAILTT